MYGYVCMAMYVWAMYVWLCMHVCIYVCMAMYVYVCMLLRTYVWPCVYILLCTYGYLCIAIFYAGKYGCMAMCICVAMDCMYVAFITLGFRLSLQHHS